MLRSYQQGNNNNTITDWPDKNKSSYSNDIMNETLYIGGTTTRSPQTTATITPALYYRHRTRTYHKTHIINNINCIPFISVNKCNEYILLFLKMYSRRSKNTAILHKCNRNEKILEHAIVYLETVAHKKHYYMHYTCIDVYLHKQMHYKYSFINVNILQKQ